MVAYNRRMGSGVPGVMDYAAPYIELAFALDDREQRKEDRLAAEEQRRIENDIRNKQLGFQETANQIAMDTYNQNKAKNEYEMAMNPNKPIAPKLIDDLKAGGDIKDKETGYPLFSTIYGDMVNVLSEGAGKKPISESFADALGSLSTTKDTRLKDAIKLKEKAVADKNTKAIQVADNMIADINNGDEKILSKLFPGQYYNYKAGINKENQARMDRLAKETQARLDKLAEKDVEESKAKRNTLLNAYKSEYDNISKELIKYRTGEKDLNGAPLITPESASSLVKRQMWLVDAINNIDKPSIGGRPGNMINQPQPQPTSRSVIGNGVTQADLLPDNGAALRRNSTIDINNEITNVSRMLHELANKKVKPENMAGYKAKIDEFTKTYGNNPQVMGLLDQSTQDIKLPDKKTIGTELIKFTEYIEKEWDKTKKNASKIDPSKPLTVEEIKDLAKKMDIAAGTLANILYSPFKYAWYQNQRFAKAANKFTESIYDIPIGN